MKTRWLIGIVATVIGCCGPDGTEAALELGEMAQEAVAPGESFGFQVAERADLVREVLERWEAATCMRLEITTDGPHRIAFNEAGFTNGRKGGQITGRWEAALIEIETGRKTDEQVRVFLTHELAHLLALTNEHQDNSVMSAEWGFDRRNQVISAALVARICTVRDCGCFSPEG